MVPTGSHLVRPVPQAPGRGSLRAPAPGSWWTTPSSTSTTTYAGPASRPGGRRELASVGGRPGLPTARPPPTSVGVPRGRRAGGRRVAPWSKVHHAIIDGVSGAEVMADLLRSRLRRRTPPPRSTRLGRAPWRPPAVLDPGRSGADARARSRVAADPWSGVELDQWCELLGSVPGRMPTQPSDRSWRTLQPARPMATQWRQRDANPAPPLPLSRLPDVDQPGHLFAPAGGLCRSAARSRSSRVRDVLGGTANDVVLAVDGGAMRRFFARRGEEPDGPLVALVPVSVRAESEQGASATGSRPCSSRWPT